MQLKEFNDFLQNENNRLRGNDCFGHELGKTDFDCEGNPLVVGVGDFSDYIAAKVEPANEYIGYEHRKLVYDINRKLIQNCVDESEVFQLLQGLFHDRISYVIPMPRSQYERPLVSHIRPDTFGFQKIKVSECKGKSHIRVVFQADIKLNPWVDRSETL